jgi:regulator of sigma E protease
VLIGLIVFFGLSLLVIAHEAGHFFVAKWLGLRVDEFGFGFPPRIFARRPVGKQGKKGETEYSLNWLPFGGFVKIAGENDRIQGALQLSDDISAREKKRLFMFQSPARRAAVIVAGVLVNFLMGWVLFSFVFAIGTPRAVLITGVQPGSPAEAVGLASGDILRDFETSESFIQFIDLHRGELVGLNIRRGEQDITATAIPRVQTREGEGALGVLLGEAGVVRRPPAHAIGAGLRQAAIFFWYTLLSFGDLLRNLVFHASVPEGVAGPVGIFSVAQEAGKLGLVNLFQLLALISINLSVLNLIPFPALDGGRLFLIGIEKIKGTPVSVRVEALVNGIGFALLILLIAGITVNDIVRLFG